MIVDRRALLAGAAATLAGLAARAQTPNQAPPAAAAPPAGAAPQAGSGRETYRFKVGSLDCAMAHDGYVRRPLEGLVANKDLREVQADLASAGMATEHFDLIFTPVAIRDGNRVTLIDTGTGGKVAPTAGRTAENLRQAGIKPEDVSLVVISHFHPDHIFGLTTKENAPTYPNAAVAVPAAEWQFWTDEGLPSRAPEAMQGLIKNIRAHFEPLRDRLRMYRPDEELAPGLRSIAAPGHTPGHTAYRISSGSDQLLVISDTTNHPVPFARHPNWHASFDMDKNQAEETRRRLFDQIVADKLRIAGFHYPLPSVGHLERSGDGYRFAPEA
jgi:glyoxylase-like metal-dependent hydrolase (beta-lactamase superfamily II)